MKNALKKMLLAGAIALPVSLGADIGASKIYELYRVFPEVVEKKNIEGHEVTFVRTESKNPFLRTLDHIFKPCALSGGYADAKGNVRINLSPIEKRADKVAKDWKSYEENASLSRDNPSWDFSKQIIYDNLKGSENPGKDYTAKLIESLLIHEFNHVEDFRKKGPLMDREQSEIDAYIEQLKNSTLPFAMLKEIIYNYENGNSSTKSLFSNHYAASKKIFEKFGEDYVAISRMSPEKVSSIAKKYSEKH